MRRALGFSLHLAHLALLVVAALGDSRSTPTRLDRERSAGELRPPSSDDGRAAGASACPMPVWRPDPNIRYAGLVIALPGAPGNAVDPAAPCIRPYYRLLGNP